MLQISYLALTIKEYQRQRKFIDLKIIYSNNFELLKFQFSLVQLTINTAKIHITRHYLNSRKKRKYKT